MSDAQREAVIASAQERALRIDERLKAFTAVAPQRRNFHDARVPFKSQFPYAAKDIFCVDSHRPNCGLAELPLNSPIENAEVIRRLDQSGATRVGFTAMTELAYEPSGYNASITVVRNPWNLEFIPGGSSSGSAAAAASGTVVVGIGSDTGGSIRIPAHCCGLTGWKPTWGVVSAVGAMPLAPFLDCIGLLARSAADLAPAALLLADGCSPGHEIKRAVIIDDALNNAEEPVRRACHAGIERLRSCGVLIDRVEALRAIDAIDAIDAHSLTIMQGEAARTHRLLIEAGGLNPVLSKRLKKGFSIDDRTLNESRNGRVRLAESFKSDVLRGADIAVLPVMPIRTPRYSEVDPTSAAFSGRLLYALSSYCRFVNMLGFPALALPVGFDDRGMPVGLQIIARPGTDFNLITLARLFQEGTDWHGRVPHAVRDLVDEELPV